jgi:hypothetical protein
MLLQLVGHQKTRRASTNADYADMSLGMDWTSEPMLCVCLGTSGGRNEEVCHSTVGIEGQEWRKQGIEMRIEERLNDRHDLNVRRMYI